MCCTIYSLNQAEKLTQSSLKLIFPQSASPLSLSVFVHSYNTHNMHIPFGLYPHPSFFLHWFEVSGSTDLLLTLTHSVMQDVQLLPLFPTQQTAAKATKRFL